MGLAIAVFGGATVVGCAWSAPSELVRRRQADFTADASHELRTPISVIEAEVDLALDRPRRSGRIPGGPPAGRTGEHACARRRGPALAGPGRQRAHAADGTDITDVADVVEGCVQRFTAIAATHEVQLSLQRVGGGPYTVHGRPELIDRLAGVLIDNACKFTGDDGRVEVSMRNWGNRVDLRVDDSGPGIPEDERDAVFDRFHRASDAVAGTGLGLAIADSVVRATQGTWGLAADLGGARMEVSWRKVLPRKGKSSPADETLTESLA